jgi:hypothetical protein
VTLRARTLAFTLLFLSLLPAIPSVVAAEPIELTAEACPTSNPNCTPNVSTTVAASDAVNFGTTYELALDTSRRLVLSSQVEGPLVAHQATWLIDGQTVSGSSNATQSLESPLVAAGNHRVVVIWGLDKSAPGGAYTLRILLRDLPNASQGAVGTGAGDSVAVSLFLSRSGAVNPGVGDLLVGGLRADEVGLQQITLAWSATEGAAGYIVHRSRDPAFTVGLATQIATPVNPGHVDGGLDPGTVYHYRVQALDGSSNAGPASTLLSVSTVTPPDHTGPGAVLDVTIGQVTSTSVALSWSPVADAGAVSYEVFRKNAAGQESRVATSANTFATDGGLQAGQTYSYQVRAVDASSNPGPLSIPVTAVTVSAAAPDTTAPSIRAVVFRRSGVDLVASWESDEAGQGSIEASASGTTRMLEAPDGVSFRVNLGPVQGPLDYAILVVDRAGNRAQLEGRVDPETAVASHRASVSLTAATSLALGTSVTDLYFVDRDGNGAFDEAASGDGRLSTLHGAASTDLFAVELDGHFAVLRPRAQQALPATLVQARSVTVEELGSIRRQVLEVPGSGWGIVDLPDTHLGMPVVSLRRADGSDVDLANVWRENGRIRFVDNLDSSYVLLLDAGVSAPDDSGEGPGGSGLPSWVLPAGAAAALLVGLAIGLTARRRR